MKSPLLNVGFSNIRKHRLQSLLLIIGIALGVALVTSVDLANKSAALSFSLSTRMFTDGSTHRITASSGVLDEGLYSELIRLGIHKAAPYVEDYVNVTEFEGRAVHIIGIDPFAGLNSGRGGLLSGMTPETLSSLLTEPYTGLLSGTPAESSGIRKGDTIEILYGSRSESVRVAGLIDSGDGGGMKGLEGVLITDISTAQELLNKTGTLSHIDLAIDDKSPEGRYIIEQISVLLPEGVDMERIDRITKTAQRMTKAFELNLMALSYLALFVGLFLIYNAVTFSVLSRRPTFAILRALGVTGTEIFKSVLIETMLLGLIGSLAGLVIGILLGRVILDLVTRTINDLYFTLTVTDFSVPSYTLIKGVSLGVLASVLAGVIPAFEASRVKPAGALMRSTLESLVIKSIMWISIAGSGFIALGLILISLPTGSLGLSLISLFFILLGASLLVPFATRVLMRLFSHAPSRIGVIAHMAPLNIMRSISRTGVAVASLTVAVSVILSVGIMIGSFRATVVGWLDTTLNADIFISGASTNLSSNVGLDPAIYTQVSEFPGIDTVATVRRLRMKSPEYGPFNLLAVTEDLAINNKRFIWSQSDREGLWESVLEDSVLVSESFAYRNGIKPGYGNTVELLTERGLREFRVAGIYYDYGYQTGVVLMSDSLYRTLWDDDLVTSLAAKVAPGEDAEKTADALARLLSQQYNLMVRSNRALKESALDTFDRTFKVTGALRILVVIVAFIGVLSSLMALQLERVKEFGVLRAIGMSVAELRKMTFIENGLLGLTAGLLSLPVGLVLSFMLIHVVNLRSFGWTMDFVLRPGFILEGVAISLIAAVSAGIYPALLIGRENTADLLREE